VCEIEKDRRTELFRAELNESGATVEEGTRKIDRRPSGSRRQADVHKCVEATRSYALSARELVAFVDGAKRSMNDVLSFPAMKSGSLMIFSCIGTVVLIPSTTVISSVRRIRAIASCRSRPCTMLLAIIES